MRLSLWHPLREMDDFFSRYGYQRGMPALAGEGEALWAPAVDISENDREYLVRAELPGIDKDQVKITVNEGVLTIAGERRTEANDEKRHHVERSYGSFVRSFSLPSDVAQDKIDADYRDGVLCVRLPRTEASKPKAVEVKVH